MRNWMKIGVIGAAMGAAAGGAIGSAEAGPENAALEYYRAMTLSSADDTSQFIDTSGDRLVLTDAWKNRNGSDLEYEILHRAAAMDHVDWGIDASEGPMTLLPHLGFMRRASRFLAADALQSSSLGDVDWAAKHIATIHRMSAHVTSDEVLIGSLVGVAIQNLGIELTNQLIDDGKIDADNARVILEAIRNGDSSDRFGMRRAIVGEWRMIGEFIMTNAPAKKPGVWLQELTMYTGDDRPGKQVMKMTRSEMIRELGGFAVYHSDLLRAWDAQDASMFEDAEKRVQDGDYGPLTELLAPTYTRAFAGYVKARQDLDDLIERLEAIED